MRNSRHAVVAVAVLLLGCAHRKPIADLQSLRTASDTFFRFLRWGDLRGASQLIVPESQKGWLDRALAARDDENLKVTDVEADDLRFLGSAAGGTGVSKVTWHRLPSITTRTERVTVEWVEREGIWFIFSVQGGPLPLAAPPLHEARP